MATPAQADPPPRWRERRSPQLASLSDAARRLLAPPAAPMISRAGIRTEARRARTIMRAAMKDQQLSRRR